MSSRGTTTLSSLGQTYCCLTREPHLPCSMLKEIPAEALEAENSLTGIETRPKEMLAVAIARALIALKCSRLSWKRGGAEEKLLLLCPSAPPLLPQGQELACKAGPSPLLLVLEEDEGVRPRLREEPAGPVPEILLGVVLPAEAQVPPPGRRDEGRGEVLVLRDAEGAAPGLQRLEDVVLEPGWVAELERAARRRRQDRQELRQPRQVLLEVRRELEEDRPHPVSERDRDLEEVGDRVARLLQALPVRDLLRSLQGEEEAVRHLLGPLREHLRTRHSVERVVDLDGRELAGVVAEHLRVGQVLRVEAPLPLLVGKPARPGEDPHAATLVEGGREAVHLGEPALLFLRLEEARLERVPGQPDDVPVRELQGLAGGLVVLPDVPPEVRGVVGVDRHAEPAVQQRLEVVRLQRREDLQPDVRERTNRQRNAAPRQFLDERRVLDAPHAMVDPKNAEDVEGLADVGGRPLLTRVRDGKQAQRPRPCEDLLELRRGIAGLARIEPHAVDPVPPREGLLERLLGVLGREVAEEAEDEPRGDSQPLPFLGERAVNAADDCREGDSPRRVGLRVEEDLGVAHAVGLRAREVGRGQVEEVALLDEDLGPLVVDVEKRLEVAEPVGLAHLLRRGEAERDPVAPRELEHHLRLEGPLDMEMQLRLRYALRERAHRAFEGNRACGSPRRPSRPWPALIPSDPGTSDRRPSSSRPSLPWSSSATSSRSGSGARRTRRPSPARRRPRRRGLRKWRTRHPFRKRSRRP